MRKDMSKVIVERPRTGANRQRKGRTETLRDDDGQVMPIRLAKRQTGTKMLNENLGPLRRFLESSAGRPWDKVYSEISEHIRPSSTVQQHVLLHVTDFVATQTRMVDGDVHVGGDRYSVTRPLKDSRYRLYVHPKTGILERNPAFRIRPSRAEPKDIPADRRRDLGLLRQAHLFADGAWYDVVLEAIPTKRQTTRDAKNAVTVSKVELPYEDAIFAANLSQLTPHRLYGRSGVYAVSFERLTKTQRKKLDLP